MSNIKLFESKQILSEWNDKEQKWYFSVQDVVEILTDSADVKQCIKKMLSRDEQLKGNQGTICPLVEMKDADTKIFCHPSNKYIPSPKKMSLLNYAY
jgi:DNA-damage-inducible protein D